MNEVSPISSLDDWVVELLVDPVGKEPLSISPDGAVSNYGKFYPRENGALDLRPFSSIRFSEDAKIWGYGQLEYEDWSEKLAAADATDYEAEREGVREVYEQIPIMGRCLMWADIKVVCAHSWPRIRNM